MKSKNEMKVWIPAIAVALGYFVDLYDLLLFSSVRTASLKELGITGDTATAYTKNLMNLTVLGMLVGGFLWGILADKKGRLSVLFLSIGTYTLANLFNAFVTDILSYQICRFVAGLGLAGELGVGITLVSELMSKEQRTKAGLIITSSGMLGAVTAGALAYFLKGQMIWGVSSWRFLFILGAIFGILLLVFRVSIKESSLFLHNENTNRGSLTLLFSDKKRMLKFLYCVLVGLPVFFIIGNFITLSPEYGNAKGLSNINPALCVLFCYLSVSIFDILGTWLSKKWKSRKKVLYLFLVIQIVSVAVFLFSPTPTDTLFYLKIAFLGCGTGYWGVLILNSVEQFGTNLRSTVATTVPNLIRGALIPLSICFFDPIKPHVGLVLSGAVVAFFSIAVALFAVSQLRDKFETDLSFQEN